MSLTYLGSLTIGDLIPGAAAAAAAGEAGISLALPDIAARLTALAAFAPQPVDFAAQLTLAQATVASVELAISLGIPAPSISAQIALVAALVAELEAVVLGVNAQLSIVVAFSALLGTPAVHAYRYAGQADALGPELTVELAAGFPSGAPTDATDALVIATTAPSTWTALAQIFKTSP